MSGIENTIVARYEKAGEKFEVLVDPKTSYEYKIGVRKTLDNVLLADEIFIDARKGERASAASVKKAFGTNDVMEVAKKIFEDGELQITTDQRRKLVEEKRARIVAVIARTAVDPRTHAPHPPQRIEKAMEEARVHIDAFKSAEEQAPKIMDELREIIPISVENARIAVKLSAEQAPRVYGFLKEYGMQREEWGNDGSLMAVCEFPAGLQGEFSERLNKLTAGQAQTKLLR